MKELARERRHSLTWRKVATAAIGAITVVGGIPLLADCVEGDSYACSSCAILLDARDEALDRSAGRDTWIIRATDCPSLIFILK